MQNLSLLGRSDEIKSRIDKNEFTCEAACRLSALRLFPFFYFVIVTVDEANYQMLRILIATFHSYRRRSGVVKAP